MIGPKGLGLLYSSPAIGSTIAGLVLASVHNIKSQGKWILSGVLLYGLATAAFGLSNSFVLRSLLITFFISYAVCILSWFALISYLIFLLLSICPSVLPSPSMAPYRCIYLTPSRFNILYLQPSFPRLQLLFSTIKICFMIERYVRIP